MSLMGGKVDLNSLHNNIDKIEFYINEEQRILSKMKNEFTTLSSFYGGTNNIILDKINNEFVCQCNMINNNRKNYLRNLYEVIDLYSDTEKNSINIINRGE